MALVGVRWTGWVRPSQLGSTPSRPMANRVRVPAVAQARQPMKAEPMAAARPHLRSRHPAPVLFRLAEHPGLEVEEEMRRQIVQWVGIPGLRRLRFGRDTLGRAEGYQFGLRT